MNNGSKKREPLMPKTTAENKKEESKKAWLLNTTCPESLVYLVYHYIKIDKLYVQEVVPHFI